MEKQIGLTDKELKRFFAQIMGNNGEIITNHLSNLIYNAYLPVVKQCAKKYKLPEEKAQDIYNDTISEVYNAVVSNVIKPEQFTGCFNDSMHKACASFARHQDNTQFNSKLLGISYANSVETSHQEEANDARTSLLYTIQLLEHLKNNPELAASKDLTPEKIEVFEDYCGINKEGRAYTVAEIAKKYQMSEQRAKVLVVMAKKAVRHMKEFEPIMHGQKVVL